MQKGFSLVEIIISVAVLLMVTSGVYTGYQSLFKSLAVSRAKIAAASLMTEQFEIVRNLTYTDVGTTGGNPSGKLLANQVVTRSSLNFNIAIKIKHVDDPFDGTSGTGDTNPNDYKLVEVSISCLNCKNFATTTVSGRVSPKGLEP